MRRLLSAAAIGLGLALAGCASLPGGPAAPPGTSGIPSAPLNLGDWRRATPSAAGQFFEHEVAGRYRAGLALAAVSTDLRRNDFNCAANRDTSGRGDPPDQICRKAVTVEGCTHTWQVHLFDGENVEQLGRVRALYDRRCGNDGLLGGPG